MDVKTMTMEQTVKALDEIRKQIADIFGRHTTDGDTRYEEFTTDETASIVEGNAKLTTLQEHYEKLNDLRETGEKLASLAEFLERPAGQPLPQPGAKRQTAEPEYRDAGAKFLKSAALKAWREDGRKDIDAELGLYSLNPTVGALLKQHGVILPSYPFGGKATLGTDNTLTAVDTEFPPESVRMPQIGIVGILSQMPNIADLCIQVGTAQNAIKYMQQTTRTLAAAETQEGALASESTLEWSEVLDTIAKISHIFPVTEETLADNPFLRGLVNSEMRLGVEQREDLQLLKGDGTGDNLTGINNRSGVQNVNWSLGTDTTAQSFAEKILRGITLTGKQFRRASAIVVSLLTWEFLRLAKDSQLRYLFAGLQDEAVPRLWGLPLVSNENQSDYDTATNVGATVGAFASDAYVVRREGVSLSVSDSHEDYFGRDTLVIKAKERVGLAVTRPAAFVKVTTTA